MGTISSVQYHAESSLVDPQLPVPQYGHPEVEQSQNKHTDLKSTVSNVQAAFQ